MFNLKKYEIPARGAESAHPKTGSFLPCKSSCTNAIHQFYVQNRYKKMPFYDVFEAFYFHVYIVLGTKQMCKTSIVDACVFFYRNNFSRHFEHTDQISAALNGELPELWHFFGLIFLPLTEQCHRGFSLFESDGMLMGI